MKLKITKKWLKAHGWHDSCVSREVLYNDYYMHDFVDSHLYSKTHKDITGWYVFVPDEELLEKPKKK